VFASCRKARRIQSTIVGGKNEKECEIPVISRPLVFSANKSKLHDGNMTSVKLNLPSTLHVLDFTVIIQTFIKYPMYYENSWKAT